MKALQQRALLLRKRKKSYNEIQRLLGVPKSTLSGWLKNQQYSVAITKELTVRAQQQAIRKLRLMAEANRKKWKGIHRAYRQSARNDFLHLAQSHLFTAGVALYWGEGDKQAKNGIVRVSNTDSSLLQVFIRFLLQCCGTPKEKIRIWLLLYPDLKREGCEQYWSAALKIPLHQFTKSHYIVGREKKRRLSYGVCTVQIYSRETKERILEWIELLGHNLQRHAGVV